MDAGRDLGRCQRLPPVPGSRNAASTRDGSPALRALWRFRERCGRHHSEVLLAIHLKRSTWDQSRLIGPWISAIVRNKLIDVLRKRGHQINVPIEDVIDTLAVEEQTDGLDHHDIERILGRLNERQRDIVQSISVKGLSIRETASRLQMTEGAVCVALHRALKTLAALYRSYPT